MKNAIEKNRFGRNSPGRRIKAMLLVMMVFIAGFNVSAQNYALTFDGSTGYVGLPAGLWNSNFSNGTAITVEYWFKGNGMNSVYRVQPGSYFVAGYYNGTNTNNNHIISNDGATTGVSAGLKATIQDGNWHHLAMTWSKNGFFTGYLDGVQVDQRAAANVDLPVMDALNCLGSLGGSSEFLNGSLDDVRIWNDVRTAQEIADNKNWELSGNEQGLVAYYKMSNGSGTSLTDNKSGNSYGGTLTGGVSWTTGAPLILNNIEVTASLGTTGPTGYSTVKAAFDAINAGTHQGAITIKVNASTTETASAVLNASGSSSSYTSANIYPTVSGITISGNLGSPLIDLNGADNVTIDGQVNATGSIVSLVISNASTSSGGSTSTIRFNNDATYNTIKYCKIQGSTTTGDQGIISFRNVATTTGNSNNTIDHNEITNAGGNRPRNALFSFGKSEAVPNSSNTVSNNNIYDVLNLSQNYTKAIALYTSNDAAPNNSYNTGWTISGNSFYDAQDISSSGSNGDAKVIFVWADQGSGFNISNNYIGGSAALCAGTWTKANGNNNFILIWLNARQAGATNYIQGNTIKNFNLTNSGITNWFGIYFNGGDNSVSNNCIGASTGTGSIIFTNGSSGGLFIGYNQGVYCSSTFNNNTIGSITVANSNGANATNFLGIWVNSSCGSATTSNNLVGSTTTPNSINATSASTSNAQTMVGIRIQGSSSLNIANNTVANLTNGTTNTTTSTQGYIYGIYPFQGVNTITGNTVHDLTIANANDGTGPAISTGVPTTSLSAGGIVAPIYNGNNHTISGNTVYNISNSYSSFTGHVAGIYHYGQSTASSVNGNFIYGLGVSSNSSSASIHGIKIAQGATTYSNNIITLGGNTTTNLYGIYESGISGATSNIYFNTVYISGSPSSGILNSACLYNAGNSSTRNFRNNIFVNARSNSAPASGSHFALYAAATGGTLTCDYNDYFVSGTGGKLGYYGSEKTELPIVSGVTGNDVQSKNADPSFASPGGTLPANYLSSLNTLVAATGTGITTDYDGGADRSLTYPAMGAFEYTVSACSNPTGGGTIAADQTICSGIVPAAFTSIADPSGHAGTLEYTWQLSTTSSSSDFAAISSSNATTYSPGELTATTWYKRLARVSCMADWTGAVASNVVQITVKPIPADQTVSPVSQSICSGASATISIGSSQTSTNYYLRNNSDNTVIDGPKAGTGSSVNFNTGALTSDKAYNVLATFQKGALAFTGNPGLKKVSLGTTLWTNNFQGKNKATVEAWIYRTASGSLHTIIGNYDGSYPFLFRIDGDRITLFVNSSPWVGGATTLAINTWYHVAGTYDGTNLKVYVNGVLDGTSAYSGNFISTAAELKIGGGLSNNTEYFPGSISDVRLWTVARTAAEISANYNLELSGNESGLVALYKMGEGTGSTLGNSATGNLYPGTLVNSPAWVAGPTTTTAVCSMQMTTAPIVTVTPNNTASAASSSPTLCIGTALTTITHTTTGATEIGAATGLPAGVTAAFASNTITIIGTPAASGTFNYSIPLTGGCGSVNATGTITVNPSSFVPAVRYLSDLTATGENIQWYAAASGGTALAGTDVLPTGTTHYYASQTVNGVESTARLDVTATVDPTPCKPTGSATQTFSSGSTVASLQATGSGIRWYAAASGGTSLATSTVLVNGTHYYASQTVDCTESASRLDISAIIN